ncbi:MAG: hypothetical protein HRU20_10145 [Pseudomonadales bacterium]|nr:hypothetical protein [Pseudomonadales bacterium]
MKKILFTACSLIAAQSYAEADKTQEGQFSFYLPIHATNLKVSGEGIPDIEANVQDLYKAATNYFTFGFKWQGDKWFHKIEVWEGKYEPIGDGLTLGDAVDLTKPITIPSWALIGLGLGVQGDLQVTPSMPAEGDLYIDMRQRITEYQAGYKFIEAGNFKMHVIGGLREYDQTVDVTLSNLSLSGELYFSGNLESCFFGSCKPWTPGDGSILDGIVTDGVVDGSINIGDKPLTPDIAIPFTLNSRWIEVTIGLQADYSPFKGTTLTAAHTAGFLGGSSQQTDVKAQYAFDSGVYVEAGYRWHKFDSGGMEITQNGGLFALGYTF